MKVATQVSLQCHSISCRGSTSGNLLFALDCLQQLCVILLQSLLSSILSLQNHLKMVACATCKQHAYLKEAKCEAKRLGIAVLLTKHLLLSRKFLIFTYLQTFLNYG